jgi:adenosylcobinamide-GDP ribazoletransferase
MTRGLILAIQFLTRLPTPAVRDFQPHDLAHSAVWFPVVGMIVGAATAGMLMAGARVDAWLGALLALVTWVGVTGGLHLDGLADLADASGAAHRDRARFLEVLRDPHVGAFGVMVLILAIVSKLILLFLAVHRVSGAASSLVLIAAWARLGAIGWSAWLPPLASGTAERFAWRTSNVLLGSWTAGLLVLSWLLEPVLLIAPLVLLGWGIYLKRLIGGMTGDCLGAGIEISEIALLLAIVVIEV